MGRRHKRHNGGLRFPPILDEDMPSQDEANPNLEVICTEKEAQGIHHELFEEGRDPNGRAVRGFLVGPSCNSRCKVMAYLFYVHPLVPDFYGPNYSKELVRNELVKRGLEVRIVS